MAHAHGEHGHSHDTGYPLDPKLPVIVLTGYLGAGKTTLLNYILNEQWFKKLAVIENEIGEVSVDDFLVEKKENIAEEVITLANGCVCCTIRGDLSKTLVDLAKKQTEGTVKLDGVLIELTGAADPAPVVQTFFMDESISESFYVDNVITLVDAKHCLEKLDESKGDPEKGTACAQIAFSSTVLLNKIDLVDQARILQCEKRIKDVNRQVDIIRCEHGRAPLDKLFGKNAFDLDKVLDEQYMDQDEFRSFYKPKMDRSISNVGVKFQGSVNMHKIKHFLRQLFGDEKTAKDFLRIKGVLSIAGADEVFVIQCVGEVQDANFTYPWADWPRECRMIFIGRGMQQRRQMLTEGIMACLVKPLRFNIGDRVAARCGPNAYSPGSVIKHWDNFNAYRIELDDGQEVWAPMDEDGYIKAGTKRSRTNWW